MPELPEVETIVLDLKEKIIGKTIKDVWTDTPNIIKKPKNFSLFKKEIIGRRIEKIFRKGKNIVFVLSGNYFLLTHLKMTGHFLFGKWTFNEKRWVSQKEGPLNDPMNLFIRVVFFFEDGFMLSLSDLRKFAKMELSKEEPDFRLLGPDIFEISFDNFFEKIKNQKGKIKQVLMNQELVSGIGNIYADEILWKSKIHPLKKADSLSKEEIKLIFKFSQEILKLSLKLKGDSMSDYRRVDGSKGEFQKEHKVYRRTGKNCFACKEKIERIKIGGRSAHFCPNCQIL